MSASQAIPAVPENQRIAQPAADDLALGPTVDERLPAGQLLMLGSGSASGCRR